MARKTKEEALITRDQLLDAAERCFCVAGVARTSLHDIAEAAGLTRGAVYWHFENKASLLTAMWERVALPIQQAFDETDRTETADPMARIRRKSCWIAAHIEQDEHIRAIMNILLLRCEFVAEMESAREHFLQSREQCLGKMADEFAQAVSAKQLPATLDCSQAAIGLLALVDGLCFHWLIEPTRFPISLHTCAAVNAYLDGLRTSA